MKKLLFVFLFMLSFRAFAQNVEVNGCTITLKYESLTEVFEAYGDVYVETNIKNTANVVVKIVDKPDDATYKVFKTTDTPKKCGEWRFVKERNKAKFTVYFVKDGDFIEEDFRICFINNRNDSGFY